MNTYSSSNAVAADSPFVKMLAQLPPVGVRPGIPPVPSQMSGQLRQEHVAAAKVLGLDSSDVEFVACRIRHLAYIVRNSRFAQDATWRSYLPHLDELAPIVDRPTGLVDVSGLVSGFSFLLQKPGTPSQGRLKWSVGVSGTSPTLFASVDDSVVAGPFSSSTVALPIGDSGHTIQYFNSTGSGTVIRFSASLVLPYSGDCVPIWKAIKTNRDLVSKVAAGKTEYLNAIFERDCVEDAVAAFILAVDEL